MNRIKYANSEITPIGFTNWREPKQRFGIKDKDRLSHIYVLGKSGVGKTTLIENMVISDIQKGKGVAVIDPHGDLSETILNYVPKERIGDVIYLNTRDTEYPVAFNPLNNVPSEYHHLVASSLISTFKKVWTDSWGPRLEYILKFSILTLLYYPEATLLDIQSLLTNPVFRNQVLGYVTDPHILSFWKHEYENKHSSRSEAISPILNKTGMFLMNAPLRNIVGQKNACFDMQSVLDQGKIFIANLSKGTIGEDIASLLGSMLITSMHYSALSRAKLEEHKRKPFYLYVDEMHSFISLSFADILAEARKYGLSLFLAHQYIDQLHEKIRSAIFGNVGTMIAFRVGADDARYLAKEFYPIFEDVDFVNLPRYSMYLKLMIDGATSKPFSADSMPLREITISFKDDIIENSRSTYAKPRQVVESSIFQKAAGYHMDSMEQAALW